MTTLTDARRLTKPQLREAGAVLARAFFDDPAMTYIWPDASTRAGPLGWLMLRDARYGYLYGDAYTTAGGVEGVALWLRPGGTATSWWRMARLGLLLAPLRFGVGPFRRFVQLMNMFEPLHKRDAPPQHWYLMTLGVDPPRQGQGVGSGLIAPVLARADADRLACYLETMKEQNLAFYRKHGFEVVVEDAVPNGGPRYWTMLREPRG